MNWGLFYEVGIVTNLKICEENTKWRKYSESFFDIQKKEILIKMMFCPLIAAGASPFSVGKKRPSRGSSPRP